MSTLSFEFAADDAVAGFRLQRLEVLNWGTFDRHVWAIAPGGHNSLLTGDIGSGKSTLVDALTTLLVPHHRIVYNKAAGAEGKERSLYSYIRGEYKSAKDDLTQAAKAVALREEGSYTVLLAHFHNQGYGQGVTLAQVFWLREGKRQPERFFVVSQAPLTIAGHFSDFGSDILDLKKRLRKLGQVEVLDHFKEYGSRFRHLFGIQNEQALELFYQTVSMKSVGKLTDFVRTHMLEEGAVEARIEELRRNFDNLNRAHESVLKAKAQVERLAPVAEDGRRYRELSAEIEELRRGRDALESWFAHHKTGLLGAQIEKVELELQKVAHRLEAVREELARLRQQEIDLQTSIDESGGRRLQQIEQEIESLGRERDKKRGRREEYRALQEALALPAVFSEEDFYRNLTAVHSLLAEVEGRIEALRKDEIDLGVELRGVKQEHEQLEKELESLRRRRSNIPRKNLEIRAALAEVLGVAEDGLPFAGELLQADEKEGAWEGAIERLLHNFALSLLVPEHLYAEVSHYVERTHLQGRLVYFRVRQGEVRPAAVIDANALCRKLRIRPDTPFYGWLEAQLAERFDYLCCEDLESFRRLPKAVTRAGQIKSGGQRHEKDDRRPLDDRAQYVLGWSNAEKIRALEGKKQQLEQAAQTIAGRREELNKQEKALGAQRDRARDLRAVADFADIHWEPLAQRIQTLAEEKEAIERSSDRLRVLREQLAQTREEIRIKEKRQEDLADQSGGLKEKRRSGGEQLEEALRQAGQIPAPEREAAWPLLDTLFRELPPQLTLTLQNIRKAESDLREALQTRLDAADKRGKRLAEKLIGQMRDFKNDFPAETAEIDASVEALGEFAGMLRRLQEEDLPRHEARFKQQLKEGTINSVALLQNQFGKEQQLIRGKIEAINTSLREIEYNPGTYIELVMDKTQDPEIRDFQQELRQCLAHTLDETDLYTEAKFLQVKSLIDRFNGREGFVDLDSRWTRKVTDVRNWFNFSASERWQEDGSEREFYSDAAGKSGGQKEKLAYTILASALAYQFGLEWGATTSRSFRFVVIDEAFGKGSDESTRYGLELFKKLNLQLLIVTPLQKIHIIEDYIRSVHYVHNQDGANSVLRNLTLAEYREEKEKFQRAAEG